MANSAVVGLLRALLVADSAEFDQAMKRSAATAKQWSKDLKAIGKDATAVGQTLTASLTLPLVAIGASATKLASDFESSFAGVRKTVQASEAEFKALETQFRTLSKTIPVNVNEINKLGEAAGALGIPKAAIKGFVEVMAGLGVATNLTAEQAADSIARIQNIFGAAGQDTDRFASTLVALGNAGASTEKEIVEMAQRIAGAGHTVGLTQAQVLAFASTLASVGINAEAGGSAISRVFLKINQAVGTGGAELAKFAAAAKMSTADFKRAFETDAAGAVQKLISEIGTLGREAGPVIQGLLGKNIILTDTILRVAGAGELLTDQLNLANKSWQENTALTEETSKRYETFASKVTVLWNKLQDVGITLGQALLPVLTDLLALFDDLLPVLEDTVKWFSDLPGPVKTLAVVVGGVAAAAGPLLILFGSMATGLGTLMASFATGGIVVTAFTATLGFLLNPITLVVGALAVLAVGIYTAATAETELEKELRETGKAFHQQTAELDIALAAYEDLSRKQHLTTEETKELDRVTRLLAEASGMSEEAFRRETEKSDTLTTSLHGQLEVREDLRKLQIEQARAASREADVAFTRLLERQEDIRQRRATVTLPIGEFGAVAERPLALEEQLDALKALEAPIAAAKANADALRKTYQDLSGATDQQIMRDRELAAAFPPLTAATVKQTGAAKVLGEEDEKGAKAAKKHADEVARLTEKYTHAKQIEEMIKTIQALGGVTKLTAAQTAEFAEDAGKLFKEGIKLPPVLDTLVVQHLALAKVLLPVTDNTKALLATTRQLTLAQLEGRYSTAGLADELKKFSAVIASSPLGGGLAKTLGIDLPTAKTSFSFAELAAPQIKAAEEALKRAQAWAESFGRIIGGVWDEVSGGLTEMFAQGLSGAQSFSDAFENVWKGLEQKLANVFRDILNLFVNGLLRGMIGYLMGNQQAFSQAFAGLAGTGANSLLSTALGTGTGAAAAGVMGPGVSGATLFGTGAGTTAGGAAAGGLGSAGALGAVAGSVAGAGAGGAVGYFVGYKSGNTAAGIAAGAGTGAGVGALLGGPIGAGVGAGVGALAGWYGAVKAGKTINDLRDLFADSQGGMAAIEERLTALGRHDLWAPFATGPRNLDAFKEALGKVQEAFEKADKAARELAEAQKKWREDVEQGFGKLTTAAQKYGTVLPKAVRDTIAPLLESKDLTADMRGQLEGLAGDPSWRTLQGIAEKYGIELSGLGAKFQSARLTDIALEYARDFQALIDGGADLTAVVSGAADELNTLYNDAKKNGVALPETLRPYMQRLVDLGLLVDENGDKIEDLNGITFENIEDALLTQVVGVLQEIRDLLAEGLPQAAEEGAEAIRTAFTRNPIIIPVEFGDPEWTGPAIPRRPGPSGPGEPEPDPIGGGGSRVPDPGIGLSGGTHGQYVDWGAGTTVRLHDKERVMTEGEALGTGSAPGEMRIVLQQDGRTTAEWLLPFIPGAARRLGLAGVY